MNEHNDEVQVNRRAVMVGGAVIGGAALAATVTQSANATASGSAARLNQSLINSMLDCVKFGQMCIDHCIESFKQGDTSLAECLSSVQQMHAACSGGAQIASLNSPHLKLYLNAALAICQACEAECRKHADSHPECKDCSESCSHCVGEIKKALAA